MSSMNLKTLRSYSVPDLVKVANEAGIEQVPRKKQDILFSILKKEASNGEALMGDGVLEIMQDGYGFLRSEVDSYLAGPGDIYISPSQIRRYSLKTGDSVSGKIRPPKDGERYFAMLEIEQLNHKKAVPNRRRIDFENLTPLFPDSRLKLERGDGAVRQRLSAPYPETGRGGPRPVRRPDPIAGPLRRWRQRTARRWAGHRPSGPGAGRCRGRRRRCWRG